MLEIFLQSSFERYSRTANIYKLLAYLQEEEGEKSDKFIDHVFSRSSSFSGYFFLLDNMKMC